MIDLDELERLKNSAYRWHYTEKLLESAPELIAMARAGLKLRALVADDAHAITFQHWGDYRRSLLKAFDAAMQEQKT